MTENKNLEHWEALRTPPPAALKKINGGRLKGMTDIDPMWRIKAMTERFGPVGDGWGWQVSDPIVNQHNNGEASIVLHGHVWYRDRDTQIPFVSAAPLLGNESKGLYFDDEAPKKALTDGIGKALAALGVAADVYMGVMDGSKHRAPAPPPASRPAPSQSPVPTQSEPIGGDWTDYWAFHDCPGDVSCPKCGGAMWDNRTKKWGDKPSNWEKKQSGKQMGPMFSCRDKSCGGTIWWKGKGQNWEEMSRGLFEAMVPQGTLDDAVKEALPGAQPAEGFDEVPF